MPFLAGNPNLAITPDFQSLVNDAVNNQQATTILANLWRIQNNADKHHWTTRIEGEACKAEAEYRKATEEEAQCQQTLRAEQEATIQEEHKKNKAKYAPIKDINIPSDPIIIPCQYVVCKMKSSDYCELSYFTNSSLEEASCSTFTANEDTLIMLPVSDGLNKWIPASATRDPKA
ncbi:uncharacterized protein EDB91DRAFT_1239250 [Suillus paluster]|uniref:uncharacterized protein n=1 Tax=Suillus paluster TaxID=48578 RepID=UPI001B8689E3|nr:uncharacterized protein EDB91DRAFT_1239250 [Suillus paluster]KAG1729183.1 hypothetical protein EDB91DRAFT_1239250 [Suillus paluster]